MQPRVLARETFQFQNECKSFACDLREITYEVEFISLPLLLIKTKKIGNKDYNSFLIDEQQKKENKKFDNDINLRDLYPISIHTKNKQECNLEMFNVINDLILNNKSIFRRVTKKQIVYKNKKTKSIIGIKLTNYKGIKVYTLPSVKELDIENRFIDVPSKCLKPLNKKNIYKQKMI